MSLSRVLLQSLFEMQINLIVENFQQTKVLREKGAFMPILHAREKLNFISRASCQNLAGRFNGSHEVIEARFLVPSPKEPENLILDYLKAAWEGDITFSTIEGGGIRICRGGIVLVTERVASQGLRNLMTVLQTAILYEWTIEDLMRRYK